MRARSLPLLWLALAAPALAQQVEVEAPDLPALRLDAPTTATVDDDQPRADYAFTAPGPGILFVAFRLDPPGARVVVSVLDATGQRPPGDSLCGERDEPAQQSLAVSLPAAGSYRLRAARSLGGPARVTFVARFASWDAAAADQDPDAASPGEAQPLVLGAPCAQRVDGGDRRDWYRLALTAAGNLVVRLEAHSEGPFSIGVESFRDAVRPDDPPRLQPWLGHYDHRLRVLRLDGVQPGQVVFLCVERRVGSKPIDYSIRAEVEPLRVEQDD